jgi:hypothetical protein
MRVASFVYLVFFVFSISFAQESSKYWVYLTDKSDQMELLESPEKILTAKAIQRRNLMGISIDISDLPISTAYIQEIEGLGIDTRVKSKWFNAISVDLTDAQRILVQDLPFVKKIEAQRKYQPVKAHTAAMSSAPLSPQVFDEDHYGFALTQIEMINGTYIHDQGYTGEGMTIAVLDAGFRRTDILPAFQTAWDEDRIVIGPDFVRGNDTLVDFTHSAHGMSVLGFMAGNIPETYVGTAPDADYILIRTEDASQEVLEEEGFWLMGAEYADSMGADLINSSLGYTVYDDSLENHTYADMDGNTTLITKAADMAASKGILVSNSAGNLGASVWYYISAPADGDSVLTVGSVDQYGISSAFSSHGPTSDDRVKPNIAAHGQGVIAVSVDSAFYPGNGTSYSAPVITGMTACLWQMKRDIENDSISNMEIIQLVENSASLYPFSNPDIGYGIPNFGLASAPLNIEEQASIDIAVYPNPFDTYIEIRAEKEFINGYVLTDLMGRKIMRENWENLMGSFQIEIPSKLARGNYLLILLTEAGNIEKKLIR